MKTIKKIRSMFTLKTKKFFLFFVFFLFWLKVFSEFKVDYSKIDELYNMENFTIFLIIKEDLYRIKEIYIVLSDFYVEKKFKMKFDGNKVFVSIPFDSLPKNDFYYYFEIVTKDNRLEYIPEMLEDRIKNLVKFIREKEVKREIVLLLPESENRIDPDNFIFSIYISDGTKNVKLIMDGDDITEKCFIGDKILSYAPEKFLKPSKYRIDVVKDGKLIKTFYFNISNKDFVGNLLNGEIDYFTRYEINSVKNFFNSYSICFYGNINKFSYTFTTYNNVYSGENFWKKNKYAIHFNLDKVNLNLLNLYYYDSFSNYSFIPLTGFSFYYNDSLTCISNLFGKIADEKSFLSSFNFDKKFRFYNFRFENVVFKDSLLYLNLKFNNNLYILKKTRLFYNFSSPFVLMSQDSLKIFKNFTSFSQKVGSEIDLKKYYALLYIIKLSYQKPQLFYSNYTKFYFKNLFFITNDFVLVADVNIKDNEQKNIFFFNKSNNDVFTNLNFIFSNKNLPSLFFSISNNIFTYNNFNSNKNFLFKTAFGTYYNTKFYNFDIFWKFIMNQSNYKFSEEDKKLSTEYDYLFSTIYKSIFKVSLSFKTLINDDEINRVIYEYYKFYFGFMNNSNNFSTGFLTQIVFKKDFEVYKKIYLLCSPDIKLRFNFVNMNFYPVFFIDIVNRRSYVGLYLNSSIRF